MKDKFTNLINTCEIGIILTQENVGEGMVLVDRGSFLLVIPSDNTDEHGYFFINLIQGHDCYSYDSKSTLIYHILSGDGEFIIDGKSNLVKSGDSITIEHNTEFVYFGKMLLILEMIPNFKEENVHCVKKVNYNK